MADILLVHGSCHGSWSWHRMVPLLAERGHEARAIDLPGRGGPGVVTLADQVAAILAALSRPALVVGHSAAGLPITAAAEADPSAFLGLVYLCAYVPVGESSVGSLRRLQKEQPLLPAIRVNRAAKTYHFAPELLEELFYHDCPAEDLALARERLCEEPYGPQEEMVRPTERSARLPRHVIIGRDDRVIPPDHQRWMAETVPPAHRREIAAGHSPFFAAPERLAEMIHDIVASLPGK